MKKLQNRLPAGVLGMMQTSITKTALNTKLWKSCNNRLPAGVLGMMIAKTKLNPKPWKSCKTVCQQVFCAWCRHQKQRHSLTPNCEKVAKPSAIRCFGNDADINKTRQSLTPNCETVAKQSANRCFGNDADINVFTHTANPTKWG